MPTSSAPQSFIPHEVATPVAPVHRSARGLADLFALASFVLFVASIALAAGVFLYREYLTASENSKVDQLERAKAAFEPSLIAELTRLDDRMRAASEILQKHIAPSAVFTMLEQATIASVGFTSFNFEIADSETMAIRMDGVAGSVNGIALQADLFSKGGMLTSPIFSNINREIDGVHFSLVANINPLAVNFSQLLLASASAPPQQPTLPPAVVTPLPPAPAGDDAVIPAEGENL